MRGRHHLRADAELAVVKPSEVYSGELKGEVSVLARLLVIPEWEA